MIHSLFEITPATESIDSVSWTQNPEVSGSDVIWFIERSNSKDSFTNQSSKHTKTYGKIFSEWCIKTREWVNRKNNYMYALVEQSSEKKEKKEKATTAKQNNSF